PGLLLAQRPRRLGCSRRPPNRPVRAPPRMRHDARRTRPQRGGCGLPARPPGRRAARDDALRAPWRGCDSRQGEDGSLAVATYAERTQGHLGLTPQSRIPEPFPARDFAPVEPTVSTSDNWLRKMRFRTPLRDRTHDPAQWRWNPS